MSSKKDKVLFFSTFTTPFIEADRRLIQEFAEVRCLISHGFLTIGKLKWRMLFANVGITWFASMYSTIVVFFSRLFRKKSIIIVGGADVNVDREMGYGLLTSRWKREFVRYALRNATYVLPMSHQLEEQTKHLCDYDGDNIHYVPPGIDPQFWHPKGIKDAVVLTVAACPTPDRILIKGIDILLTTAVSLPHVSFLVIGIESEVLLTMSIEVPPNVTIKSYTDEIDLLSHYQHAKVYCQPSRIESFSFALAQGMLCECIPVATNVGGMPEVIGNVGFLVPPRDPKALVSAVKEALDGKPEQGQAAREWIRARFSLEQRKAHLQQLISE